MTEYVSIGITLFFVGIVLLVSFEMSSSFTTEYNEVNNFCYSKNGIPTGKANPFFPDWQCSIDENGIYKEYNIIKTEKGWGLQDAV